MVTAVKRSPVGLQPELELLLSCARTQLDDERRARIRTLLHPGLNWEHLLSMARQHRLAPLLFYHLNTICPAALPQAALVELRNRYYLNARRNLLLTGELLRLLKLLAVNGIPAIPYKGPVLATRLYGNLALRESRDLDILVQRQHVLAARDLLVQQGYQPLYRFTPVQEQAALRSNYDYHLWHAAYGIHLEFHWHIVDPSIRLRLTSEDLWGRLERMIVNAMEVSIHSPEDLLLILCVHGSKHLWERLFWLVDIAELMRLYPGVQLSQVMVQAEQWHCTRMLLLGLHLASALLDVVLPDHVQQYIENEPAVTTLAARLRDRLCRTANEPREFFERSLLRLYPRLGERWQDVAHYYLHHIFRGDWQYYSLPRPLFPLYYILRPMRLALKYACRLGHLVMR